jgi:hypothetical protein
MVFYFFNSPKCIFEACPIGKKSFNYMIYVMLSTGWPGNYRASVQRILLLFILFMVTGFHAEAMPLYAAPSLASSPANQPIRTGWEISASYGPGLCTVYTGQPDPSAENNHTENKLDLESYTMLSIVLLFFCQMFWAMALVCSCVSRRVQSRQTLYSKWNRSEMRRIIVLKMYTA